MSLCEQVSERAPLVAAGKSQWTAEEAAHLAACESCRLEWELVTAAGRIGLDIPAAINAHHVTERVVGRLRAERRQAHQRRRDWALVGLAAAAALTLVVWTGRLGPRRGVEPTGSVEVGAIEIPLPELDSLRAPELDEVLRTLDAPVEATVDTNSAVPGFGDLDSQDLEHVLNSLEG